MTARDTVGGTTAARRAKPAFGAPSPVVHAGPSDATEAVVCVHGSPGRGDDWADLVARVGEHARVLAPDMPGFGDCEVPSNFAYTVDAYGEYLGALIAELGIERVHLVAHDFGGPWALAWAASHPDAFASATLINTGVLIDYEWHRYAKIWRTPIAGELFQATTTRPGFRLLLGRENRRLYPDAIDRLYAHTAPRRTKRAILKIYRATPAERTGANREALRAMNRPALVLWGTDDAYIPWDQAERQREAFPSARVELLEGLGHWPFLEDPGRVAALVVPFLLAQVAASATS